MKRTLLPASFGIALLLALPLTALAAPPEGPAPRTVIGTVIYVGPSAFAINTGTAVETFAIPAGARWADTLTPTQRVAVTWQPAVRKASRAVVSVEPTPTGTRHAASRLPELESHGEVAYIGPMTMAVETNDGVELFEFANGSTRPRVGPGDDVTVWFRVEPRNGRHVVSRVEVEHRHPSAGSRPVAH
jgi:hypothetical protein